MNGNKWWMTAAAIGLVAVFVCRTALSGAGPIRFKGTRTVNAAHAADTALEVRTDNGGISVKRSDRADVEITAYLKCATEERLDAAEIIAERTDDQALKVYVKWPEGRRQRNEGCDFEILLPDALNMKLHTANGEIRCEGLRGHAHLQTSNGKVVVDAHDGSVKATTSNGAIWLSDIAGPVQASTSNGSIDAAHITGSTDLRTSNGSAKVISVGAPVHVHTSNGSIRLELSPSFAGEMTASTSHGKLDIAGLEEAKLISSGKKRITFALGESDQKSSVSTSNGSIRIRMAD